MKMQELTEATFTESTRRGVCLVDFYGADCGACKMLKPVLERLSDEMPDAKFFFINAESNPKLAMQFRVRTLPSMFVMKDMAVECEMIGMRDRTSIVKAIKEAING